MQYTDNAPEGRGHVSDGIPQEFRESIYHVGDLMVSETYLSNMIENGVIGLDTITPLLQHIQMECY